ncbi:VanZ family protein [Candidatus Saccharibacteria bacterium]|nr:VanZ family protein [Candidatus Saccharibacteria bacterium]
MKTIRRYWRIIFPIFFIVLIWIFSGMNGQSSHNQSSDFASAFGITNAFARKLAHFVLFGALGYSISSFVKGLHTAEFPNFNLILYPIILCVVYGAIDEVHQLTIIGRNATIGDVFIDFLAGIIGTLVYVIIFCFWRRWRIHRQLRQIQKVAQ